MLINLTFFVVIQKIPEQVSPETGEYWKQVPLVEGESAFDRNVPEETQTFWPRISKLRYIRNELSSCRSEQLRPGLKVLN